jgi:hypothetical protein
LTAILIMGCIFIFQPLAIGFRQSNVRERAGGSSRRRERVL